MSFRYKIALLSLVSMALIYGWYFAHVLADRASEVGAHVFQPMRLIATIMLLAIVNAVGAMAIALTSKDREARMDERERAFDRKATAIGYYLLLAGALVSAALVHVGVHAGQMANAVLFAVVLAECVRQGAFLILHHRAG